MQGIDIVSGGEYSCGQSDPLLHTESYVIFREEGKKYLVLKWHNSRKETLTGLDFTVIFYDGRGVRLGERRVPAGGLRKAGQSSFTLGIRIELPENCLDFRVRINRSRYGKYAYVPRENGVEVEYDDAPRRTPQVPPSQKSGKNGKFSDRAEVRVRRPVFPLWTLIVTFALFFCAMAFMAWQVVSFSEREETFLRNGVRYTFVDGNKSAGSELIVSGYYGNIKDITIEKEIDGHPIKQVEEYAFSYCESVRSVVFEGDIVIGTQAFDQCRALKSVYFKGNTEIGENAFRYSDELRTVNFDNVTKIGEGAFYGCRKIREVISDSLTFIGRNAFDSCENLNEVELTNSQAALSWGDDVFSACVNLQTVTIEQEVDFQGESLFAFCHINDLRIENLGGEMILDDLFESCDVYGELWIGSMPSVPAEFCRGQSIHKITIGHLDDPVIGERAFGDCKNLTEADLPPVREIRANAFEYTELSSFDASAAEYIGEYAFQSCYNLKSIDFSGNTVLREIGDGAFSYCTTLTSIDIPDSTQRMGDSILRGCYALKTCAFPYFGSTRDEVQNCIYFFGGRNDFSLEELTVRSGTALADRAFSDLPIKKVNLPQTLRTIGSRAFSGCVGLEEIALPDGLTDIGDDAFFGCYSLTQITLPETLQSIGESIFADCVRLYEIYNDSALDISASGAENVLKIYSKGEASVPKAEADGYTLGLFGTDWLLIGYPRGEQQLSLPSQSVTEQGIGSYQIADSLFYYDPAVRKVVIPSEVSALGKSAFYNCTELEEVEILGSSLTELPENAFYFCESLWTMTIPQGITQIGKDAFRNSALQKIILPESLTSIGEDAFTGCTRLRTVYNLSKLALVMGGDGYGNVAKYADKIYTTL